MDLMVALVNPRVMQAGGDRAPTDFRDVFTSRTTTS